MDDWQAQQQQDEAQRIERVLAALKHAEEAGTPKEDVICLADECGLGIEYIKESK